MTPIEKRIDWHTQCIDATRELSKLQKGNDWAKCMYAISFHQNAIAACKMELPTEAEHTKQVGTGFAEWVACNYYMNFNDKWENGECQPKTTSELYTEYINQLNKKG